LNQIQVLNSWHTTFSFIWWLGLGLEYEIYPEQNQTHNANPFVRETIGLQKWITLETFWENRSFGELIYGGGLYCVKADNLSDIKHKVSCVSLPCFIHASL
jgi:hypothetical protein